MATFFCACFAKTSVVWIPLLYVGTSTHFKLSFVNHAALDQGIGNTRVGTATQAVVLANKIDGMMMNPIIDETRDS